HRLFLAALIIAAKAANDKTYKNKSFVVFTDNLFPVSEINLMERQLLHILDFNIMISSLEYDNMCERIRAVEDQMAAVSSCDPVPVPFPSPPNSHLSSSLPKSLPSLPSLSHRSFNMPSFIAKFTASYGGHMSPVSPGTARMNSAASSYSSSYTNGGFMRNNSPGSSGKRMDSVAQAFAAPALGTGPGTRSPAARLSKKHKVVSDPQRPSASQPSAVQKGIPSHPAALALLFFLDLTSFMFQKRNNGKASSEKLETILEPRFTRNGSFDCADILWRSENAFREQMNSLRKATVGEYGRFFKAMKQIANQKIENVFEHRVDGNELDYETLQEASKTSLENPEIIATASAIVDQCLLFTNTKPEEDGFVAMKELEDSIDARWCLDVPDGSSNEVVSFSLFKPAQKVSPSHWQNSLWGLTLPFSAAQKLANVNLLLTTPLPIPAFTNVEDTPAFLRSGAPRTPQHLRHPLRLPLAPRHLFTIGGVHVASVVAGRRTADGLAQVKLGARVGIICIEGLVLIAENLHHGGGQAHTRFSKAPARKWKLMYVPVALHKVCAREHLTYANISNVLEINLANSVLFSVQVDDDIDRHRLFMFLNSASGGQIGVRKAATPSIQLDPSQWIFNRPKADQAPPRPLAVEVPKSAELVLEQTLALCKPVASSHPQEVFTTLCYPFITKNEAWEKLSKSHFSIVSNSDGLRPRAVISVVETFVNICSIEITANFDVTSAGERDILMTLQSCAAQTLVPYLVRVKDSHLRDTLVDELNSIKSFVAVSEYNRILPFLTARDGIPEYIALSQHVTMEVLAEVECHLTVILHSQLLQPSGSEIADQLVDLGASNCVLKAVQTPLGLIRFVSIASRVDPARVFVCTAVTKDTRVTAESAGASKVSIEFSFAADHTRGVTYRICLPKPLATSVHAVLRDREEAVCFGDEAVDYAAVYGSPQSIPVELHEQPQQAADDGINKSLNAQNIPAAGTRKKTARPRVHRHTCMNDLPPLPVVTMPRTPPRHTPPPTASSSSQQQSPVSARASAARVSFAAEEQVVTTAHPDAFNALLLAPVAPPAEQAVAKPHSTTPPRDSSPPMQRPSAAKRVKGWVSAQVNFFNALAEQHQKKQQMLRVKPQLPTNPGHTVAIASVANDAGTHPEDTPAVQLPSASVPPVPPAKRLDVLTAQELELLHSTTAVLPPKNYPKEFIGDWMFVPKYAKIIVARGGIFRVSNFALAHEYLKSLGADLQNETVF
ncbi:hypothetical protein HDU82_000461, partial [Entophlyctis luteolus]